MIDLNELRRKIASAMHNARGISITESFVEDIFNRAGSENVIDITIGEMMAIEFLSNDKTDPHVAANFLRGYLKGKKC